MMDMRVIFSQQNVKCLGFIGRIMEIKHYLNRRMVDLLYQLQCFGQRIDNISHLAAQVLDEYLDASPVGMVGHLSKAIGEIFLCLFCRYIHRIALFRRPKNHILAAQVPAEINKLIKISDSFLSHRSIGCREVQSFWRGRQ